MIGIYDNGGVMLGNVRDVIRSLETQINKDIDMFDTNMEDLLNDLKDLLKLGDDVIVCIDYDRPMGDYGLDYWTKEDRDYE